MANQEKVVRNDKDLHKVRRTLALYNMIPNLIWSVINLIPVSIFCFNLVEYKVCAVFLVISLVPVFFPNSFLDKLQIAKDTRIYKQLGVHLINKVAQNGVIINWLIKRKFPDHKVVSKNKSSINKLISQTYIFEKFHLILFLFFCLIIFYAFMKGYYAWACIILLSNVAYNIYPNLLQQYIRLKLVLFNKNQPASFHNS